jgi:hypothetical protein
MIDFKHMVKDIIGLTYKPSNKDNSNEKPFDDDNNLAKRFKCIL